MFELMQSVMLIFIEIMCCKIFYETFGEVRYKGWINTIQFILLLSCICFLSYGFSEYFVIRQVVGILIFSVFMLWHVRISLKKSFVLAVLFDALLLAMDASVFLIMGQIPRGQKKPSDLQELELLMVATVVAPNRTLDLCMSSQCS